MTAFPSPEVNKGMVARIGRGYEVWNLAFGLSELEREAGAGGSPVGIGASALLPGANMACIGASLFNTGKYGNACVQTPRLGGSGCWLCR